LTGTTAEPPKGPDGKEEGSATFVVRCNASQEVVMLALTAMGAKTIDHSLHVVPPEEMLGAIKIPVVASSFFDRIEVDVASGMQAIGRMKPNEGKAACVCLVAAYTSWAGPCGVRCVFPSPPGVEHQLLTLLYQRQSRK
jgi:hypothetical protein